MIKFLKNLFKNRSYDGDSHNPSMRTLLANERTLLAWIRTSLALLAGGLALTQFGTPTTDRLIMGIGVIIVGAVISIIGYVRYKKTDTAIRANRLPDMGTGPIIQVIVVLGFAVILIMVDLVTLSGN